MFEKLFDDLEKRSLQRQEDWYKKELIIQDNEIRKLMGEIQHLRHIIALCPRCSQITGIRQFGMR